MVALQNILLATDFSEPSVAALDYAKSLAQAFGARIHVLHVLEDLAEGFAVRVRSTPTYFVDGVPVSWFSDPLMEEYLRKTYLKGAGLPAPAAKAPAAAAKPQAATR